MQHRLFSIVALMAMLISCFQVGCARRGDAGPRADSVAAAALRKELLSSKPAEEDEATEGEGEAEEAAGGWGNLRGTFRFVGTPPKPAALDANKDPEVCSKHKLVNEEIMVAPGGYLQNAVILVRTSNPQVHPDYAATAEGEKVLDNRHCRFEPHVQVVRTTQTLVVKNSDPVAHNSNFDAAKNGSVNPIIPGNGQIKQKFSKEETQPIKVGCNIHPWMRGWVFVRANPYVAVSSQQGEFSIEKLPAGKELEFQLWHERPGALKGAEIDGLKVDAKGRFKIKLADGENKSLEIKVPEAALR